MHTVRKDTENLFIQQVDIQAAQYIPIIMLNMRFIVFCCYFGSSRFTHILQAYFTGTGAIVWLPQCQWSNHEGYG